MATALQQAVQQRSDQVGHGRVLRVHRQHRLGRYTVVPAVVATLAGAAGTILLAARGSALTGVPALVVTAGWIAVVVIAHSGRSPGPPGQHWMAVTERGLLIWQRNLSAATPIPWSDLTEPDGPPYGQLHWRDPDRGGRLTLTGVCGQGDVRRAVRQGRPTGRWTVRRVLGPAFGVVAVGLVCWLAGVPVASYVVLGERPDQLDDLARICNGGSAFRGSAPYRQAPGQPLVVFEHDQDDTEYEKFPVSTLDGASDDTAASVQLVACSRFLGRANRTPLQTCPYTGGVTWSTYQGRWRVDVYQARTGTRVTSRVLDGSTDTAECQSSVPHAEGTPRRVVLNTSPPYDAVLGH